MPSHREELFRDAMRALIQDELLPMPASLRRDIADHLYRRDTNGLTLCFDSPQREQLIELIYQWADVHAPDVAERLMYLGIHERKGVHTLC